MVDVTIFTIGISWKFLERFGYLGIEEQSQFRWHEENACIWRREEQ